MGRRNPWRYRAALQPAYSAPSCCATGSTVRGPWRPRRARFRGALSTGCSLGTELPQMGSCSTPGRATWLARTNWVLVHWVSSLAHESASLQVLRVHRELACGRGYWSALPAAKTEVHGGVNSVTRRCEYNISKRPADHGGRFTMYTDHTSRVDARDKRQEPIQGRARRPVGPSLKGYRFKDVRILLFAAAHASYTFFYRCFWCITPQTPSP